MCQAELPVAPGIGEHPGATGDDPMTGQRGVLYELGESDCRRTGNLGDYRYRMGIQADDHDWFLLGPGHHRESGQFFFYCETRCPSCAENLSVDGAGWSDVR